MSGKTFYWCMLNDINPYCWMSFAQNRYRQRSGTKSVAMFIRSAKFFPQLHKVALIGWNVGCRRWLLWAKVKNNPTLVGLIPVFPGSKDAYIYTHSSDLTKGQNSRCTSDHPCTHGEGHCSTDSDCERDGYHICGAACIYGCWCLLELHHILSDPGLLVRSICLVVTNWVSIDVCET